jgi:hypothetical protein
MIALQTRYRHVYNRHIGSGLEIITNLVFIKNIVKTGVATSGDTAIHISLKLVLSIDFYFSGIINH